MQARLVGMWARWCAGMVLWVPAAFGAQDCHGLMKLATAKVEIKLAEPVAAGTFTPPAGKAIPGLPAFCRVAGVIHPSADSNIEFELWMPSEAAWNAKFRGIDNGGFAGAIGYPQLAAAVAHGYAAVATDTGHEADNVDARWALDHPEKIVDFGYRAIHEMTVNGKTIVQAYYAKNPARSYFSGCSNGGRQALMEAQRFPEDYDGIVAGAPANYWTHLLSNAAWNIVALLADMKSYIPAKKLPAIETAALAACDANDGVKDGVIDDPTRCHFDPSVLECKGAESDTCLTGPQVTALKKLYSGAHTSAGKSVFPGFAPGGEAEPAGWGPWITGPAPERSLLFGFGTQFFKNMVFDNAGWDYHTFNVDRDTDAADKKMSSILNATNPDLSRFEARGGKLILFHGWNDAAISPYNTINYYNSVLGKMGRDEARRFTRLFMVPGLQHCAGGQGPDDFGQGRFGTEEPEHNVNSAMERWIENGAAPEHLIGSKRPSGAGVESAAVRTRPLCAYPLAARYKGSGGTDDAANFTCANPNSAASK